MICSTPYYTHASSLSQGVITKEEESFVEIFIVTVENLYANTTPLPAIEDKKLFSILQFICYLVVIVLIGLLMSFG